EAARFDRVRVDADLSVARAEPLHDDPNHQGGQGQQHRQTFPSASIPVRAGFATMQEQRGGDEKNKVLRNRPGDWFGAAETRHCEEYGCDECGLDGVAEDAILGAFRWLWKRVMLDGAGRGRIRQFFFTLRDTLSASIEKIRRDASAALSRHRTPAACWFSAACDSAACDCCLAFAETDSHFISAAFSTGCETRRCHATA